jgi:phosphoheptose isomerase
VLFRSILISGVGAAGLLGRHLAGVLSDRLEHDRPGLAATFLSGRGLTDDSDPSRGPSRQVEALAHPGDLLVVFSLFGEGHAAQAALRSARERDMRIIVFSGGDGGPLAEMLEEGDLLICAPSESIPRILETQLWAVHSLGACIDYLLLGA